MKTGVELIADERQEQIEKHQHTKDWDARHNRNGQLAQAALYCLDPMTFRWPWDWAKSPYADKIWLKSRIDQLVVAGALIAAEIDRLQPLSRNVPSDETPQLPPIPQPK